MAKIFKKYWLIILLLLATPACLALLKPGFFPTHDYIYVARIYQLDKALKSGHFPVRWAPDLRYGEPLFNFYAPLVYYLGSLIYTIGFNFLNTTKILFGLSLILSGITMYLLARELFGKWGGAVSAILYVYAPYRAVDLYIRGALSESWGFIFMPLIFLFILRLSKQPVKKNLILLSLSLAGLFYTHNVLTVLFTPFVGLWALFLIMDKNNSKLIKKFFLAGALSVGLAASFLLPAFFEKKLVQTKHLTTGYFDYRGHFVGIKQWFDTTWEYGASLWGPIDDLSFQIGLVHWAILGLSAVVYLVKFKKLKKFQKTSYLFFVACYLFSLFMQHNKSTQIWEILPVLKFIQFPWRFLAISIFFASLFGGWLVDCFKRYKYLLMLLIVIAAILVNYKYFRPEKYYFDSIDEHYISHEAILHKNDEVPKDYLPIWVKVLNEERIKKPKVLLGKANVSGFKQNVINASFKVNAEEESIIEVPIAYFPGWPGEPSELGLITLKVPEGEQEIDLNFKNTPIRSLGNIISVVSFGAVLVLLKKNEKLV